MANIRAAFIALLTVFSLFTTSACVAYSGGSGTQADPYKIADVNNWQQLMNTSAHWNKYFLMTPDVNLAGVNLTPVGNSSIKFIGVFDGSGHVIRNATINLPSSDSVGLFGNVGFGGQIKNLGIADANITGMSSVGGLVGRNEGNISWCYATGSVTGTYSVGGLVGYNDRSVTLCYATGSVNGVSRVGGLLGVCGDRDGNTTSCYATGTVTGTDFVGGLVGYNYRSVTSCYATGSVNGVSRVGGLLGACDDKYGNTTSCYATGAVNGTSDVGGLIGDNGGSLNSSYATGSVSGTGNHVGGLVGLNDSRVYSCYATGAVSGTRYVGGLVGSNSHSSVTSCYATGSATGRDAVGGLVGFNDGSVSNSFWDMDTSGKSTSSGGTGLTTIQMKTLAIFRDAGWGAYGWVMADGVDYPRLSWEGTGYPVIPPEIPFTGSGTQADPYQIAGANNWQQLMNTSVHWNKYFLLTADLDLAGITLTPVGDFGAGFIGVFDGNGHVIRNATISLPSSGYVGLFGYVDASGQIKNLGVEDAKITGYVYVGGLVGMNRGSVTSCYATGSVTGSESVGGLAGYNDSNGSLAHCYATGSVWGNGPYVGGLVGRNYQGKIIRCYSTGRPTGTSNVGGLCGYKTTGGNYEDTGNFWDTQVSQRSTSAMGTGKTTTQMKTQSTFTDAGWDFVSIWWMPAGDYPKLIWEQPPAMTVQFELNNLWMYQNLPGQTKSQIRAEITVLDDPAGNSDYTFNWEFVLPGDVTISPVTVAGGNTGDMDWTFAAPGCNTSCESNSGQTFKVRLTVVGNDYGNSGVAEKEFAIALLGDVNNDTVVNVADRSIINVFWRDGAAGPYTLKDCDLNCDGVVNVADRSIANAIWRGALGGSSVGSPCPLR